MHTRSVHLECYASKADWFKVAPEWLFLANGQCGKGVAEKQAVKFIANWVDQTLLRAIRNIVAHGAIEVSADMDKEYYRNKIQAIHGVQLQVRHSSHYYFLQLKHKLSCHVCS